MIIGLIGSPSEAKVRHHVGRHHLAHGRVRHRHHRRRAHLLPVSANAPTAELVFDAQSGRVLAVANPNQLVYPASLTKMMTLYLAFRAIEAGRVHLDDTVLISDYAATAPPTKLGLRAGQQVSLDDLIRGSVTESANDAARALAQKLDGDFGGDLLQMLRADLASVQAADAADAIHDPPTAQDAADRAASIGEMHALADSIVADGSEEDFARLMTLQARILGMDDTTFRNASGLPDPAQVTTAPDMAMLAYAIVHLPQRDYSYFSLQHFDFHGADHHNHNLHFLTHYDGADGIKTGYTQGGGFNVVDSARRGDTRLIAIVMGRRSLTDRESDVRTLLDDGFVSDYGATPSVTTSGDSLTVGETLDLPQLTSPVRRSMALISTPASMPASTSPPMVEAETSSAGPSMPAFVRPNLR
jgi:D-alanyl-D-alanine carboxypeptidase